MCTVLFSFNEKPETPLVLLANRDEFYDRPTAAAAAWEDHPSIFGGRDLVGGGTWMAITDTGKIAAVTNYRDPSQDTGSRSRGTLVSEYLTSDVSPEDYLISVEQNAGDFSGFNLLVGRFSEAQGELYYFSNRGQGIERLSPGLYGLSNHLLDTRWPKVVRGKKMLSDLLSAGSIDREKAFGILSDDQKAPDDELPYTGIGEMRERLLSPIFIKTPIYGTRCSTVVVAQKDGKLDLEERVWV